LGLSNYSLMSLMTSLISRHINIDSSIARDSAICSVTLLSIGGILWGIQFWSVTSTALTILIAYLAYRSNRTSEKIIKLQLIGEAITIARTLHFTPLFWSGHAQGMTRARYQELQTACHDSNRIKVYFSEEVSTLTDDARNSVLELLANVVVTNDGYYNSTPDDDQRLSRMRQLASDKSKLLLDRLSEIRKSHHIGIS